MTLKSRQGASVHWLALGLLGLGCTGQVMGPAGVASGSAGVAGAAAGQTGASGAGGSLGAAGTGGRASTFLHLLNGDEPAPRMHKLTAAELANSLHDLLGAAAPVSAVEPDTRAGGFASAGASTIAVSPAGVGLYEDATGGATAYAFADATRAGAVLSCVPTSMTDAACVTKALTGFGRRAFRRPLTDAETSRFTTLASTIAAKPGAGVLVGLRHAVWAMLQSPSFLYRVELGAASAADGGRLKYDGFEMASRLAGALWASAPDDTLLDAAAAGKLATADGVRAQAERLLADPRAHRALTAFVDDLFGKLELEQATKDPAVFPAWTTTLRDAMQEELERRVDDVVFAQKGDFLALYESKATFVNDELAKYYGLPAQTGGGWRAATFPADSPRAGLLGSGAILSAFALPQRTSPTARGKFVATSLLCKTIPDPPPGVPPLPAMGGTTSTLRQKLEMHREAASCSVCHALMDPIGFGMETFDGAGQYRTKDNGQPIDATGALDGATFDGLAQLGAAVHADAATAPCLVSKVYTFAEGRTLNGHDAPALDALAATFAASGNRVDRLMVEVVSSDAFRFVTPDK